MTLAVGTMPPLMSKTYPLMLAEDCGLGDCGEGDSRPGALGRSVSLVAAQDETAGVSGPGETVVFPVLIQHLETPVPVV